MATVICERERERERESRERERERESVCVFNFVCSVVGLLRSA